MLIALALSSLALLQKPQANPSAPFDRVVSVELDASDPARLEGWGPSRMIGYEAEFEGTLHVWASSELQLALRIGETASNASGSP